VAGYAAFQRTMTLHRLVRDHPLRNNIYAFNASRTRFYPYQFKPLIKLLDSANHRLLICDEVGLGKTIEAGLILCELRARQDLRTVLVVCPSGLADKWKLELDRRFEEEFRIFRSRDLSDFLDEYEADPERKTLSGIVPLESLRSNAVLERLEALTPSFDLVILD
jgi:SNF2 family DNA or RNA helicase